MPDGSGDSRTDALGGTFSCFSGTLGDLFDSFGCWDQRMRKAVQVLERSGEKPGGETIRMNMSNGLDALRVVDPVRPRIRSP